MMNHGNSTIFSENKRVLYSALCPSSPAENESNRRAAYFGPILALRFVPFWHMALFFHHTGNYLQNESNFSLFEQFD